MPDQQTADPDCTSACPTTIGHADWSAETIHHGPDSHPRASDRATRLPTPDGTTAPSAPQSDRPSVVVVPRPGLAGSYSTPGGAHPAWSTKRLDPSRFDPARPARSWSDGSAQSRHGRWAAACA